MNTKKQKIKEALENLRSTAQELDIELILKHVEKKEATNIAEKLEELLGRMEVDAIEGEEEFIIDVYRPWAIEEDNSPADQGNAASTADALHAEIVSETNKLAEKVAILRSAWDAAGYSKDDGVRDDLLLHALDIAGDLANPASDLYADDPSMRTLANNAKRLAKNLSYIADDFETEFEG